MRVFVLCTGRCGSMTFSKACEHLTNYTAGHETRAKLLGDERMSFPDDHIEVDNHLSWQLGRLEERYGDEPFYVHLTREDERVAQSFHRLIKSPVSNVVAYQRGVLMIPRASAEEQLEIARDYVRTVNSNIRLFLKSKSKVMTISIDEAAEKFLKFVENIGATGNLDAAVSEFSSLHNTKRDASYLSPRHAIKRAISKLRPADRH